MSKTTIRNLIIAGILTVVAVGVFGLMVYFVSNQGDSLKQQITALEEQYAQQDSFLKSRRLAEETEQKRILLQSYFLGQAGDGIDFLNQVEKLAPQSGVSLKTRSLDSVVNESEGSEWIQVEFSFSGLQTNVQNFLKILENFPYVSRINSVTFSTEQNGEWSAEVEMMVRVLAYDE